MNFANYNAFRVALQHLIEGDDYGSNTFSVNTLDIMIGLGEQRVYRDLRASTMVASLAATVTSNAATLPADLIELKEVYFSGKPPLDIIPLDRLRAFEADGTSTGADTRYCAQDGDTLRFWPSASGSVIGRYYAKPAALESGTWADQTTFARYPEIFMFAAMCEAMPHLGMENKVPLWEAKYAKALADAQHDERMRVYGGGPLKMRTR